MKKPECLNQILSEFIMTQYLVESCHDGKISESEKVTIQRLQKGLDLKRDQVNQMYKDIREGIGDYSQQREVDLHEYYQLIQERLNEDLGSSQTAQCLSYLRFLIEGVKPSEENQFGIGEIADEECSRLLQEVSQKDWEQELDDFRQNRIEMMLDDQVMGDIEKQKEQGIKKGALVGAVLLGLIGFFLPLDLVMVAILVAGVGVSLVAIVLTGGVGILVSALMTIVGLILYTVVLAPLMSMLGSWFTVGIGALSCAMIGGLVGGGLGVKFQRFQLMKQSGEMKSSLRPNYLNYILDVRDLLCFWESKVEVYLHDRKSRVKGRIREASRTRTECLRVISELEDFNEEENRETIAQLKEKILLMNEIIEDAYKVNHVLQRLEDQFVVKIEQLRVLVRKKEQFERDQYRHEELKGKAKKLIGKSSEIAQEWEQDKEQIQIQITGMVQAFQSQLHHTKDFVQAEIQMVQETDPKAWIELQE